MTKPDTPHGIAADSAADAFAALGSPVRLEILRALVRAGGPGLPVGRLQERIAIPASTLSHHLRAMVQAGLLEQKREGRALICCARYELIQALAGFLISECCADAPTPAERSSDQSTVSPG